MGSFSDMMGWDDVGDFEEVKSHNGNVFVHLNGYYSIDRLKDILSEMNEMNKKINGCEYCGEVDGHLSNCKAKIYEA